MVTVEEAKQRIEQSIRIQTAVRCALSEALGGVLAEDLVAPVDLPGFRQSAMDGYAMQRSDLERGLRTFTLVGEIAAGKAVIQTLNSGETLRIFTGAAVPENADMVVIQEHVDHESESESESGSGSENTVRVINYSDNAKSNIREVGEQIRKGEIALKKGHVISPATIGFLAGMGVNDIAVYRKPIIGIYYTGDELKKPGEPLAEGEIYESNAITLKAALNQAGFEAKETIHIKDDAKSTFEVLRSALLNCDVVLVSGGISVGDHDHVKKALLDNGVQEVFHKVMQKPGKPLFFGTKAEKVVFAMPGNPASLLVCFYEYVLPALRHMTGHAYGVKVEKGSLLNAYHYRGNRPEFLKAIYTQDGVQILDGQASFVMKSFAEANCLVYIYGSARTLEKGSEVEVHLF